MKTPVFKRLQFILFTLPQTLAAGQVLSAPLIQCPGWQQYAVEGTGVPLRSSSPIQLFEVAVANGKAVQAKAKPHKRVAFDLAQNERTNPNLSAERFFGAKPPSRPATFVKTPAPDGKIAVSPQCRYVVVEGDTLINIAAKILGSAKRWKEIARANELSGSSPLNPGQVLQLPCATAGKGSMRAVTPLPLWTARSGEYVTNVIKRWSKSADYTYQQVGIDESEVTVPIYVRGSFKDALKELIGGFEGSGRPLPISIYSNGVVRIGMPNLNTSGGVQGGGN
ncbi:LysM peptidoglycan-binding domain-containing protein [uncultured Ruegeria sp.]|uniref:LysM peptidoglycan-binding domain-containing protein n=1 Tax=uncultured Ruegeria sp. TaxID=259304 RepID=UPI00261C0E81|nr:LysM peptidoglycan-binding domain-containing protein [uncultured Ruegeria sp.]